MKKKAPKKKPPKKQQTKLQKRTLKKPPTPPSKRSSEKPPVDLVAQARRLEEILSILKREYPEAKCALNFETPYQLLIATILSAQCTDVRVNLVTPELFKRYPDAKAMAKAQILQIEELIRTTGFFRNKAKSILETSKLLTEKYEGRVPATLEELIPLRGVGRKTANVVLGNAFGIPGLVVDTHVGRLCRRMGFTKSTDPVKVEQEMMKLLPESEWTLFSHLLIEHGRQICDARKPLCGDCPVYSLCYRVGVSG